MPTRLALCTSLTVALLAAPASALAADVVTPSSVARSTTVPAGGSSTLTLRCPTEAVALNAAVTRRGGGVIVHRSTPGTQAGDWSFRLSAFNGASARQRGVRALLRCVRLRLPVGFSPARLSVSTQRPPAIRVPGRSSTRLVVRCPRGFASTGYGLDQRLGELTVAEATPSPRGWDFRIENLGAPPQRARLSVRCLKRTVAARRGGAPTQLSFQLAQRDFSNTVGSGSGSFTHSCRRSEFSVATGSVVDPAGDIVLTGSHPARTQGGRWAFSNATAGDQVQSFLVCLSRRSQFG